MPVVFDMSIEEAQAKIVEYFSRPGAALSLSDNEGTCYYRHPEDGRACAVGCLISDEDYVTNGITEGTGLDELIFEGKLVVKDEELLEYLEKVQKYHDEAASVEEFLGRLNL